MEPIRTVQESTASPDASREEGVALILALFFAFMAMGIIVAGNTLNRATRTETDTQFRTSAQATQFARSGLVEGVGWFRRQTSQPVVDFAPVLDSKAAPPIFDTDDPDIGLVRDFRISGNLWGRYEIWRPNDGGISEDPEVASFREQFQVEDTGLSRRSRSEGTAWVIRSIGYVYENNDATRSFRERPNRVVASQALEAEIIRRKLSPPGAAAVTVGNGRNAHANTQSRIIGGDGAGIYYPAGTGRPTTGPRRQRRVTGTPATAQATDLDVSFEGVFGLGYSDLKATANVRINDDREMPVPIPTNGLVVVEAPSVDFDADRPLLGTGIVVVKGNCRISAGSNSAFNGLLFVDGNLIVRAPSTITGAVICTGNFNIQGSGDFAEIIYDAAILESIAREFGQYRFLGAFRPVFEQDLRASVR